MPSFDASAIHATIQRAFASAGLDTSTGPMRGVTETIQRALAAGGLADGAASAGLASVINVDARVVSTEDATPTTPAHPPLPPEARPATGRFERRTFRSAAGSRAYKLYLPALASAAPPAVVVMLHGCTQSADDFAAGTRMNLLADQHGFLVIYPEQTAQANPARCWNWFQPPDQQRGAGEPAVVAGIVAEVARQQGADLGRVFVAGLSAGAAMAVVLGETYPDVFAGVGAHSGLPYGSAHDVPSAMAAMKGGRSGMPALTPAAGGAGRPPRQAVQPVPVIVFHGDRDHTVQHANGEHIVQQARRAHGASASSAGLTETTQTGVAAGGRRFSRTVHADPQGQARIERWTLHGAGHAWSGGDARGTYTDAAGPDASAEMVRFFLALPRCGEAGAAVSPAEAGAPCAGGGSAPSAA